MTWIFLAVWGGLGGLSRFVIEEFTMRVVPRERHWGTFAVNVLGCLGAGLATHLLLGTWSTNTYLTVGFLGGFTTFSSALAQPVLLFREGRWREALLLVAATPLCGGLAFAAVCR